MTPEQDNRLFLLDAYALIFRAYYAFAKSPRINSKGQNTSAIFGFANTVLDLIATEKPSHLGVVFDPPGGSMRTEQFADYKANRDETPEDIKLSVPYIMRFLEAMRIPVLMETGYEADDVIGTMAVKAKQAGYRTYIMTSDKDMGQLVNDEVFVYKPAAFGKGPEILGVKEVCERFQITDPLQVIDVLGLMGDAADNIPGIPGVGEKTAQKLLAEYGSMERVLENADQIKGKLGENIRNFADQGRMSRQLATIMLDAPVEFRPDELIMEKPDKDKITLLFSELEFRTMLKRVLGEDSNLVITEGNGQMSLFGDSTGGVTQQAQAFRTIADTNPNYTLCTDLNALLKQLLEQEEVCFDTETTGLEALEAELVGLSFSWMPGEAVYVAVADEKEAHQVLQTMKPFFESTTIRKVGQNVKYDLNVLKRYGIDVKGPLFDTMVGHYLLQPDMKHGMDYLSETYLGYQPISIETLIGKKGRTQGTMRDVPVDKIMDYACEDADVTLQLKDLFYPQIKNGHLKKLSEEVEMPLIRVLSDMESEGINLDVEALRVFSNELEKDILRLQDQIYADAGVPFNLDSPRQLGEVLFDHLKVDAKAKKTKTGQYATSEDILAMLTDRHAIIPRILEYRSLRKLKGTYVDTLPEMVNKTTSRVHTTYLQTVAATGRLASNNPNLQNIPIKTEKGREIRKAFIPRNSEYLILSADYSQIELRIIAALSGDTTMIEAFRNGQDIHASTAAKVFGVSLEEVTRDMRSRAKAVNFGIIYGQTAFGLSQNLSISRTEAKDIIDSYFATFPGIRKFIDDSVLKARENGYVETILKRRRYLKDINSANQVVRGQAERNAINAPIQGSAADIIKLAMLRVHETLRNENLKTRMLLQVHDELVFDLYKTEKEQVMSIVRDSMENAFAMEVPLLVEMNAAINWLEAH
jgi:DNA polymerase-1